ncbi:MAG: 2-dehydropantoate 2-reductase, partial [Spirochaetaceae bacterium]
EGLSGAECATSAGGRYCLPVSQDTAALSGCAVVFVFVKATATAVVAKGLPDWVGPATIVVTLQNGLGNREALEEALGRPVVAGTTAVGAARSGLGTVLAGGNGPTVVGGGGDGQAAQVAGLLAQAGLPVSITPNPQKAIWEKAVVNAAINPLGALLRVPNGQLLNNPSVSELQQDIIAEAVMAAGLDGVQLDAGELFVSTQNVCRQTASNRCSMLQDIEAGRSTEIDAINGRVLAIAAAAGHQLPVNSVICRLVRSASFLSL